LPSTTLGSPALGRQEIGMGALSLNWRSGSYISTGPVAQLRPMTSMPSVLSAVMAAPISVPGNMRPVISMVTWAWIGTMRPWRTIARWHAAIAALPESRSNMVSTSSRSTPPSSSP
jgi:hypothetical protein